MSLKGKPVILVVARGFWNEKELADQEIFRNRFELVQSSDFDVPKEISQRVTAIVLGDTLIDGRVMDLFPNLKTIARNGTGYDNVNLEDVRLRGITLTRVSALNAKPVSEFVLGLILALSRNIMPMHGNMLKGIWQKSRGKSLSEMTIGIVGIGSVGSLLAEKLRALGAGKILGWNRSQRPEVMQVSKRCGLELVELPKLMSESDGVVVSVLLTPETVNLINQKLLSLMRTDAFLVNVSRGAVVDEEALARLLISGKIGGAALDVYSSEPPFDKPFMQELMRFGLNGGNVILSPHSASLSKGSEREIVLKVAKNVISVLDGKLEGLEIL